MQTNVILHSVYACLYSTIPTDFVDQHYFHWEWDRSSWFRSIEQISRILRWTILSIWMHPPPFWESIWRLWTWWRRWLRNEPMFLWSVRYSFDINANRWMWWLRDMMSSFKGENLCNFSLETWMKWQRVSDRLIELESWRLWSRDADEC